MKRYWVASARGADFEELAKLGFRVFYPMMDDYVFLEAADENQRFQRKQEELRIKFLRDGTGKKIVTVSESELDRMKSNTQDGIIPGAGIKVVEGHCSNLSGKVLTREGSNIHCEVYGYKRVFMADLTVNQVVKE